MNNYKNIKIFFEYLITNNYKIQKDDNTNDILKIYYNNNEIKCKYILLFTEFKNTNNNTNTLLWSFENPYIDQKTQWISKYLKYKLDLNKKINTNNPDKKEISLIVSYIIRDQINIVFDDEVIKPLWIITDNSDSYKHYYMITDIIYF
jgi:hypothetical protein